MANRAGKDISEHRWSHSFYWVIRSFNQIWLPTGTRHCASTGTPMVTPSWNWQFNDLGNLHLVINEQMEDQRKKMMSVCVFASVCVWNPTLGKNRYSHHNHKTNKQTSKKLNHDPHMHIILVRLNYFSISWVCHPIWWLHVYFPVWFDFTSPYSRRQTPLLFKAQSTCHRLSVLLWELPRGITTPLTVLS